MKDRFLVFGEPWLGEEEIAEVADSMRVNWIGTGPKVHEFERRFAARFDGCAAAAVGSCTAALHLACAALDLEPGDEVITSALTFCATVNAIIHAGGTPVLADIDPRTCNMDPAHVEALITPRTRAMVVVHYAGRPCEMDALVGIASRRGLRLIEDCAHSIEGQYRGQPTGTFGDFGCFSFYATKNMTTGEGGMVISRDAERIAKVKRMALHGLSSDAWSRYSDKGFKHYRVVDLGFKYNMMDLQAAIGLHQLARLDAWWERRRMIWERYQTELQGLPLFLPELPEPWTRHACHLFPIAIRSGACAVSRDEFLDGMTARKIGVGVHYLAIAEHPYYQNRFGWKPESLPNATAFGRATASLPLSAKLEEEDLVRIVAAVRDLTG